MRPSPLAIATFAAGIMLAGINVNAANAQKYAPELMTHCSQKVGQMKFEGWAADRNREMMMMACHTNNGVIPGEAQDESNKPVGLKQPHKAPARHH